MGHLEDAINDMQASRRPGRAAATPTPVGIVEIGVLLQALKKDMGQETAELSSKIDTLTKDHNTFKNTITNDIKNIKENSDSQDKVIHSLTYKIEQLEKDAMKTALIIRGIPSGEIDSIKNRNLTVKNILQNLLKVNATNYTINYFGKLKQPSGSVIVKFENTHEKFGALKNGKNLKDTPNSISEWLSASEKVAKSILLRERKLAIEEGHDAWVQKNKFLHITDATSKIKTTYVVEGDKLKILNPTVA